MVAEGRDTPLLMVAVSVMVVVVRWRMARGRAWYFGFISSFMPATGGVAKREGKGAAGGRTRAGRTERPRQDGERGTLNYNPLRDTAEFAFKIKRA